MNNNVIDFTKIKKKETVEEVNKKSWNSTPYIPEELRSDQYKFLEPINEIDMVELSDRLAKVFVSLETIVSDNIEDISIESGYCEHFKSYTVHKFVLSEKENCSKEYTMQRLSLDVLQDSIFAILAIAQTLEEDLNPRRYYHLISLMYKYISYNKDMLRITKFRTHYMKEQLQFCREVMKAIGTLKREFGLVTAAIVLQSLDLKLDITDYIEQINKISILSHTGLMSTSTYLRQSITKPAEECKYVNLLDTTITPKYSAEYFHYDSMSTLITNCISNIIRNYNLIKDINLIEEDPMLLPKTKSEEEYIQTLIALSGLPVSLVSTKIHENLEKCQVLVQVTCRII